MFTVKQVSTQLNLSAGAVYKAIRNGDLEHHRFGSSIRISERQLTDFVESMRVRSEREPVSLRQFKHL